MGQIKYSNLYIVTEYKIKKTVKKPHHLLPFEEKEKSMADEIEEPKRAKKLHRGIPEAIFLDDVDGYMAKETSSEAALQRLDEQYQKNKFMEANLIQKKMRLSSQIPDIKSTLAAINCLRAKKDSSEPLKAQFMLSDQLFVNAKVPATDKVCLWLGANVMLEYEIADADVLLTSNLQTAQNNLEELADDLCYLRDQITTTEVSMARIYNWDVKRRQKLKTQAS